MAVRSLDAKVASEIQDGAAPGLGVNYLDRQKAVAEEERQISGVPGTFSHHMPAMGCQDALYVLVQAV